MAAIRTLNKLAANRTVESRIPPLDLSEDRSFKDIFSSDLPPVLTNEVEDDDDLFALNDSEMYQLGRRVADISSAGILTMLEDLSSAREKVAELMFEFSRAVIKTIVLSATALSIGVYPGRSPGKSWPPFKNNVFGPENSIYFTDPYTFLHFEDGIITYLLWGWWGLPGSGVNFPHTGLQVLWDDIGGLVLALACGFLFELIENSDFVISRLVQHHGTSQFYRGDSRINVFGDILALGFGYSMSKVFTMAGLWYVPIIWLVLSEIVSAITFRDNLLIGTLQTIWPQDFINKWQEDLVPMHLRGMVTRGYWQNKVRDPPEVFVNRLRRMWPSVTPSKFQRLSRNDFGVSKGYWNSLNLAMARTIK